MHFGQRQRDMLKASQCSQNQLYNSWLILIALLSVLCQILVVFFVCLFFNSMCYKVIEGFLGRGKIRHSTPGVGDGQGGLACCDSWGRKESDTTELLIWSDLTGMFCDVAGARTLKLNWRFVDWCSSLSFILLQTYCHSDGTLLFCAFFFLEKEISIYLFICFWLGWVFIAVWAFH